MRARHPVAASHSEGFHTPEDRLPANFDRLTLPVVDPGRLDSPADAVELLSVITWSIFVCWSASEGYFATQQPESP